MTRNAKDPISAAIYAGMVAYSKEHARLRNPKGTDKVDARCFLVAARAFNEAMAEDDDPDLIDDEPEASDPTSPVDRMYENEIIK
ncbi:hypothetical protein JQX09_17785 [Sulfitobacter pseudonitzschiae]|uniref:Uncharacterized protein n=1 Tax=Pseudosulfitobacter pseudonitzschiae TaxID=1402135 RepID=A0A9Q2NRK2_9RHOB|nr:hypothetical protein [Pseudosulfitobacter pseudonitzschiae]MBM2293782.1 hypothetical protein [Pseudosulfitobacter pseudonitzschiae]MBM2298700.1 hypothetical protein [Pseudosulfitobacter pseudonitzschiae]MBM2303614.1 hypothetical protein [Pseudosulfitobacter pseudonitzschiae]MBM2313397.1 hypothetical protein [Pseudosulfitobacter pseudonitzschiae]MBM2318310.1 hypothetical protein [Pseudosulfitobacter pseudonitzschiae]